ncbi:MAG: serine hydrolase [Clostridia bacterium]|nr:serine hydrolase [Clostridia bacterium]
MNTEAMEHILSSLTGHIGFYCRDLTTGETLSHHAEEPVVAASVIKLTVMAEAFRRREEGTLDFSSPVSIRAEDKKPSCGALTYLHDGLTVTVEDLVELMIILSDNTATNLLIDRLGTDAINRFMTLLGLSDKTRCRRKLFMPELSARGITNHVTARDIGLLLEKLERGEVVSRDASAAMLQILRDQRLNGKMPFHLAPRKIRCAHKTGEDYDDGITHDCGIIYAAHPVVFCFLAEGAQVPAAERALQDLALMAAGFDA